MILNLNGISATMRTVAISGGFTRIFLENFTTTSGTVIDIVFTSSLGAESTTPAGTETVYVRRAQLEAGSFASSYIPTTTAAVTRNVCVESNTTTGNIDANKGSIYLEFIPQHVPSGTIYIFGSYVDASNYTAILHDATNLIFRKCISGTNYDATIANTFVIGTKYKVTAMWGQSGSNIALSGVLGTANSNSAPLKLGTTYQIGANGNGAGQPFATIRNVKIWKKALKDSELVRLTT
jgi:hypothetical protein